MYKAVGMPWPVKWMMAGEPGFRGGPEVERRKERVPMDKSEDFIVVSQAFEGRMAIMAFFFCWWLNWSLNWRLVYI